MTANYDQPPNVEKRVRFFDGQYLQDQDFIDEQKYHVDRQRRHNRTLHIAGIADGLAVNKVDDAPARVTVAAGTAIDSDGRQLLVASAQTVDLPASQLANKTVNLYLFYREQPADLQTQAGSKDYSRWLEQPEIRAVAKGDAVQGSYPPVLLAELMLDGSGNITSVNSNVRQYSGLRLPGPSADGPTLRADASGLVQLAGSLSVTGNVGIGTTAPPKAFQVALPESSKGGVAPGAGVTIAGGDSASIELRGTGTPYIDFAKDASTTDYHARIRLTATDKLAIEGANLGIGTTDPGINKLKVTGNTYLEGTLTVTGNTSIGTSGSLSFGSQVRQMINLWSTNFGIGVQDGTQYFRTDKNFAWYKKGAHSDGELTAGTNGTVQMVIKDGNVGIGTNGPAGTLDVQGSVYVGTGKDNEKYKLVLRGPNKPENDGSAQDLSYEFASAGSAKIRAYRGNSWDTYLQFLTNAVGTKADNPQVRLHINHDGNVGIGTTGPTGKLDVSGAADTDGQISLQLRSGNSGAKYNSNQITLGYNGTAQYRHAIKTRHHSEKRAGNAIDFYVWQQGTDTADSIGSLHTLTLDGGNVGIGTTDPGDVKLKVEGNAYVNGKLWAEGLLFHWTADNRGWCVLENKAGNVTGNAGGQAAPSDLRFKTALRPIRNALEKVLQLNGKCYRWGEAGLKHFTRHISETYAAGPDATEDENRKLWDAERHKAYQVLSGDKLGLIAQELEAVVPEVVHEDEEGYKYIQYQQLTALLVEAIKEQNALIQSLSGKVAALEGL